MENTVVFLACSVQKYLHTKPWYKAIKHINFLILILLQTNVGHIWNIKGSHRYGCNCYRKKKLKVWLSFQFLPWINKGIEALPQTKFFYPTIFLTWWYFNLRLFDKIELMVLNKYDLRHLVAKILRKILNSFNTYLSTCQTWHKLRKNLKNCNHTFLNRLNIFAENVIKIMGLTSNPRGFSSSLLVMIETQLEAKI